MLTTRKHLLVAYVNKINFQLYLTSLQMKIKFVEFEKSSVRIESEPR